MNPEQEPKRIPRRKCRGVCCFSQTCTQSDSEVCNICLETNCIIYTNCNHHYCAGCIKSMIQTDCGTFAKTCKNKNCVGCIKAMLKIIKKDMFKCAYCRCNITKLTQYNITPLVIQIMPNGVK